MYIQIAICLSFVHSFQCFQISNVKKQTLEKHLHESIQNFKPKQSKHGTLTDLFRNIKKEKQLKAQNSDSSCTDDKNNRNEASVKAFEGFKTAKEHLQCTELKLDENQRTLSDYFKVKSEVTSENKTKLNRTETDETGCDKLTMDGGKDKMKMLFGDDFDSEEEKTPTEKNMTNIAAEDRNDENPDEENEKELPKTDNNRDYKHAKKKSENESRKRKLETDNEEENKGSTNDVVRNNNGSNRLENLPEPIEKRVKRPRLRKSEIGTLVVKLLTPAYAQKRFDSRDTFKSMARTISHALLDKGILFCFFI